MNNIHRYDIKMQWNDVVDVNRRSSDVRRHKIVIRRQTSNKAYETCNPFPSDSLR